jgi:hypothetical protein
MPFTPNSNIFNPTPQKQKTKNKTKEKEKAIKIIPKVILGVANIALSQPQTPKGGF